MWPLGSADTLCHCRPLMYDSVTLPTRSVAAGFGRHGMPLPASNDTGTALSQDGSDWSHVTLQSSTCGWCGSSSSIRIPSLKFVGLGIRKIWRTVCVSINGPGDCRPDLWSSDLETGKQVASKVGNLCSKFGHARPLGSPVIRYVRDNGQKQCLLPLPYGRYVTQDNDMRPTAWISILCQLIVYFSLTPLMSNLKMTKRVVNCRRAMNELLTLTLTLTVAVRHVVCAVAVT